MVLGVLKRCVLKNWFVNWDRNRTGNWEWRMDRGRKKGSSGRRVCKLKEIAKRECAGTSIFSHEKEHEL